MSTPATTLSYEATRAAVEGLRPALADADRTLVWVDAGHTLAVARDARGRIEVFIVCEQVTAANRLVEENLQHQVWKTRTGDLLPANRLVLPSGPQFDGVAAFICAELIENGAADGPVDAFRRSEPVISLALRRAALSDQALIGLAGELFALASLVEALPDRTNQIINSWFGSGPSTRDLQLGPVGIEIKTTSGSSSYHHVQGLHQVEFGVSVDGTPETHLFLLSLGIEWLAAEAHAGRSVPDLVDVILGSLHDTALQDAFLDRVKQYGGDAAIGYDHHSQRTSPRYARPFLPRFERLYDLRDDRLCLLTSADVEQAVHVEAESISFRVRLPNKVRGDVNPVAGMPAIAARVSQLLDGVS